MNSDFLNKTTETTYYFPFYKAFLLAIILSIFFFIFLFIFSGPYHINIQQPPSASLASQLHRNTLTQPINWLINQLILISSESFNQAVRLRNSNHGPLTRVGH